HRLVAASIGVAIPADRNTYGYLSEHHSFGETEEQAGEYAEELAAEMLATTLDVEFDPDTSWDEKKEILARCQSHAVRDHARRRSKSSCPALHRDSPNTLGHDRHPYSSPQ